MEYKTNDNTQVKYHNNIFQIVDKKTGNEYSYQSQLQLNSLFYPENFEMFFLFNTTDEISENSIFKLYTDGERIGWIFPIQSLESQEHDFVQDKFYLSYAYVAIYKLLKMIDFSEQEYSDFNILQYYSDTIQILIYDKENVGRIDGFNISNYAVDLFCKGYSFSGQGNVFTCAEKIDKNIRVKQLPESIRNISYINILFMELIPLKESSYSKFHLIYQIIEILIGVVFNYKIKEMIVEIAESPDDLFEKRDKLNDITLERNRVRWLFDNFSNIESQKDEILNNQCKRLLVENKKNYDENNTGSNLYSVRCLIVHSLYSLNNESRELLAELNNSFLDVVLDILTTFHVNTR